MKPGMPILKTIAILCFCVQAHAAQYNAPEVNRSGIIESIDIGSYQMIVEGYRYSVSQTADVEIAGSYGAFTMLTTGMRIEFAYHRYDDGRRVIFRVRELLPNESLERA